jgi:thiamine-phosphate pyrophosphorylase
MNRVDFKLYLITDRSIMGSHFYDRVEEALKGGVRALQLREKGLSVRELFEMAVKLREVTLRYKTKLFINDRIDVALSVGADGVQLGQKSLPVDRVRNLVGEKMMIGVSTHSKDEAFEAEHGGADFITFGPIHESPSKKKYGPPVGIEMLENITGKLSTPLFGIGGIERDRVSSVLESGAWGVALISAIFASDNTKKETKEFVRLLS